MLSELLPLQGIQSLHLGDEGGERGLLLLLQDGLLPGFRLCLHIGRVGFGEAQLLEGLVRGDGQRFRELFTYLETRPQVDKKTFQQVFIKINPTATKCTL